MGDVEKYLAMRAAAQTQPNAALGGFGLSLGAGLYQPPVSAAFNGNLASLFPGAYQVLQTDLGLTLGSTLLANAGNTSTTVQTFTGGFSGPPVPIWTKATNTLAIGAGAQFNVYYDGAGVTPVMTGVTPAVATPVALTGAATGLSVGWAAGTSVTNDGWKATCAALADQSGNAKHGVQPGAGLQPLVTAGNNGYAGIAGDGVDDILLTDGLNLPAPGTTPYYVFAVFRYLTATADAALLGNGDAAVSNLLTAHGATPATSIDHRNGGTTLGVSGVVTTNWNILEIKRSNNAGDTTKVGAVTATGNTGNSAVTNGRVFKSPGAGVPGNAEIVALVYTPNLPIWTAVRAAVASKYSGVAA